MDARESFLDVRGRLRPDAKRLRALLPTVSDATVATVSEAVAGYVLGRWTAATYPRVLAASGLSPEQLHTLFSGLLVVCRAAARSRAKPPQLASDMQSDLRMSPAAAAAAAALFARLQKSGEGPRGRLPSVARLEWRVEVTVSTSSLSRVFQPVLLMQLTDSDGQVLLFECSRERFQQLRYQAAMALKSCEDTAALPILKIE